jgi:hypothetical protein
MVEGIDARGAGVNDGLDHSIRVSGYVGSGNAQQADSLAGEPLLARSIKRRPLTHVV